MLSKTLKTINLEYTETLPLRYGGTWSDDLFNEVTGVDVSGISGLKYKMKKVYETLDVSILIQGGVDVEKMLEREEERRIGLRREHSRIEKKSYFYGTRKPLLGEGSFEDLRGDFLRTDAFHVAYSGLKLARTDSATLLWVAERPFGTYKELLEYLEDYDPREDEPRSTSEIAQGYKETLQTYQEILGEVTLVAGHFYLTLFTYLIIHIGWPMLVRLGLKDPELLDELLLKYAAVARKHVDAWSRTGTELFLSHDDIAYKGGLFFPPSWFRKHVKPLWREIWRPIKDKGIKLVYSSDGDYRAMMDDLIDVGADGFCISQDPMFSHAEIEQLVEEYGRHKILMLCPSYEVLTKGGVKDAVSEAKWISGLAHGYPAVFLDGNPSYIETYVSRENLVAFYKTWFSKRERSG